MRGDGMYGDRRGGDVRLWTFAITEKEPAIVTGTDVRLAPWNSVLFCKQGGWQR